MFFNRKGRKEKIECEKAYPPGGNNKKIHQASS
jgi:hypothetical protein